MLTNLRALCAAIAVLCCAKTSFCLGTTVEIATEMIQSMSEADRSRTSLRPEGGLKRVEVIMRVHSTHLEHIFHFGFLNQYQSKRSSGSFTHDGRLRAENTMLGYTLDMHPTSLHPKYGTLFVEKDGVSYAPDTRHYGEIFFKFKDHVVQRTTYSMQDSLGLPRVHPLSNFGALDRRLSSETVSSYLEAQIWGDLTFEDVAEIWIPHTFSNRAAVMEYARVYGIDVYEYEDGRGDWDIARRRTLSKRHSTSGGKAYAAPTPTELLALFSQKPSDSNWMAAIYDFLGRIGSDVAESTLDTCRLTSTGCHLVEGAYSQAKESIKRAQTALSSLFHSRSNLRPAIARFFSAQGWPMSSEMAAELGHRHTPKSMPAAEEIPVVREEPAVTRPVEASIAEIYKPADSRPVAITREDISEMTHAIRDVLRDIRSAESSIEVDRHLKKLSEHLSHKEYYEGIIAKLGDHSRFAHVVSKYSDLLPRPFIKVYFAYLKKLPSRESAVLRAFESCAAVFGEAA